MALGRGISEGHGASHCLGWMAVTQRSKLLLNATTWYLPVSSNCASRRAAAEAAPMSGGPSPPIRTHLDESRKPGTFSAKTARGSNRAADAITSTANHVADLLATPTGAHLPVRCREYDWQGKPATHTSGRHRDGLALLPAVPLALALPNPPCSDLTNWMAAGLGSALQVTSSCMPNCSNTWASVSMPLQAETKRTGRHCLPCWARISAVA